MQQQIAAQPLRRRGRRADAIARDGTPARTVSHCGTRDGAVSRLTPLPGSRPGMGHHRDPLPASATGKISRDGVGRDRRDATPSSSTSTATRTPLLAGPSTRSARSTGFYDPRTAVPGPPWASLHAKCVVVDDRKTLVTSANFTDRGQARNIEAGVLIEDEEFSRKLTAQWRTLVSHRLVERCRG